MDSLDSADTNSSMSVPSMPSPQDIKPEPSQMSQGGPYFASAAPGYPGGPGGPGFMGQPQSYYSMAGMPQGQVNPLQSPNLSSMGGSQQSSQMNSPTSTMSGGASVGGNSKHNCAICGDRASGKHYGVYSCEGCKGFFKRTVRKDLTYACRDEKKCFIDKRQRNRCQYCRYMKCLSTGMKREAVQEERQRNKDGKEESENLYGSNDMPPEKLLEADVATSTDVAMPTRVYSRQEGNMLGNVCQSIDRQLVALVQWAKMVPHFIELPVDDQIVLLRTAWNELLIMSLAYRSISTETMLLFSMGEAVTKEAAESVGVGFIFERILVELVNKFKDMCVDRTELACLKAVVLFNPDAKGVQANSEVEGLREKVYATLEEYCRSNYPDEPGRFAKLLLRLPALRSIGLKSIEYLFFFKLIGEVPVDTLLTDLLDNASMNYQG